MSQPRGGPLHFLGRFTHRFAIWVVLFWLVVAGALNIAIPQLEQTVSTHSADFLPNDLPANQALERMAEDFEVSPSNASGSIVLVTENGITPAVETYYRDLLDALTADEENVAYVLDTYSSPVTRPIAVSPDEMAIQVMVTAEGAVGSTQAHHATQAIRGHINEVPQPDELTVYYSGPTPTLSDLFLAIDTSLLIITVVSVLLISALLFIAYRRLVTALIPLLTIGIVLATVRPIISLMGEQGVLSVSNFTIAIMTALMLGAGTDYAIFSIANYQEARRAKRSVGDSVMAASTRTGPILIASALTIAAACASMVFTKIGMFATAGPPTAIAIMIALAIALTLPPALLSLAGRRGWGDPLPSTDHKWRKRGVRIIRHAGVYTAAALTFLVGFALVATTYQMNWDESAMPIYETESVAGYDAVYEHYSVNEIAPEYLTFRSDHDLRNTADLASLEMAALAVSNIPEVDKVRSITRPDGSPLPEAATGYQTGIVGSELGDAHEQMVTATPELQRLAEGAAQLSAGADDAVARMPELVAGTQEVVSMATSVLDGLDVANGIAESATGGDSLAQALPALRESLQAITSTLDAFAGPATESLAAARELNEVFGPLIGAPSAECVGDPACLAARAAFAELDRALQGRASAAVTGLGALAALPPDTVERAQATLPQVQQALGTVEGLIAELNGRSTDEIRSDLGRLSAGVTELSAGMTQLANGLTQVREGTETTVELTGQLTAGLQQASEYLTLMSAATTDGAGSGFYLPPEGFENERFVEGSRLLISPDGHTARMLVTFTINPYSQEAMAVSRDLPEVAAQALTGTTLDDAEVTTSGLASLSADMQDQVVRDFLVFATVAVLAVLLILMVLLRSIIAPILLMGTTVLSFWSAVGVSVLVWQHIIGFDLDWSVLPVAFMALIAVGADYSMLFADRIRHEARGNGMVRGIIRGFGSTGGVITTAGLVFAITMFALMSGTVLNLVQIGFTIGIGLILDIAIVRTILIPAAMTVLGDKMWWPAKPENAGAESAVPVTS